MQVNIKDKIVADKKNIIKNKNLAHCQNPITNVIKNYFTLIIPFPPIIAIFFLFNFPFNINSAN